MARSLRIGLIGALTFWQPNLLLGRPASIFRVMRTKAKVRPRRGVSKGSKMPNYTFELRDGSI